MSPASRAAAVRSGAAAVRSGAAGQEGGGSASSLSPTGAQLWRAARGPVAVGALVIVLAGVVALLGAGPGTGLLDPRGTDPEGGRALARLLDARGVDVRLVERGAEVLGAAGPGSTVFVVQPGRLAASQAGNLLATGADLVLVAPGSGDLELLAPGVELAGQFAGTGEVSPQCELPAAQRAGGAEFAGLLYTADDLPDGVGALLCYPAEAGPATLAVRSDGDGRTVTVLGDGAPLTNERLADAGHAALGLGLLGGEERLLWYLPALDDVPAGEERSLAQLVPRGVVFGAIQVLLAVGLLGVWRARRLGPVVAEPLPVVVRSAESVEGRARLYRRARASDRAAEALRRAARHRLVTRLGLPRAVAPAALVDAAARHTGRPTGEVGALLYGAPGSADVTDDPALVRLADALDILERQVRSS